MENKSLRRMMKIKLFFIGCISFFIAGFVPTLLAADKPNIIIILADDLGYGDLGCYGNPTIRTPNLDRMAAEGLRFTDFYAGNCYCTPSRAALLTGRLPIRSGMSGRRGSHVLYPNSLGGIPAEEITISEALKAKGYATCAIGKWHLGDAPEYSPTKNGFDNFLGTPLSNDSPPIDPKFHKIDTLSQNPDFLHFDIPLLRGTNCVERPVDQTTLTQRYTEEAIRFMNENKKKPFFIYFAHTFPHVPLFASEKFKGKSLRGRYGDTVEELDASVGTVLEWLRKEKLEKNTFVFFTSDNGPWLNRNQNGGSAGLFRDGKGGAWEGGYRVPAIAHWPGKISVGVNHGIANAMDLFNTALHLADAELPKDRPMDGIDLTPVLFGKKQQVRDTQFCYYADILCAVRRGKYKAHFVTHDGYSKEEPAKHDPPLLFNVAEDPSERFDVAAEHPEVVAEMTKIYNEHLAAVTHGKSQY
ncbi:MAG: sulfatase [Verrucomicrobiota bacterium]